MYDLEKKYCNKNYYGCKQLLAFFFFQTLSKKKSRDQPNATTRHVLILHVTITRDV